MVFSEKLTERFKLPSQGLQEMDLFQRYEVLEQLGLLAHETNIGEPERPFADWTQEELHLVSRVFDTWPKFADAEAIYTQVASRFAAEIAPSLTLIADRKDAITLAAQTMSSVCKAVCGEGFPAVEVDFQRRGKAKAYGGLRPDGKIEINLDRLSEPGVRGSEYQGDISFVELLCHESTHLIQRHAVSLSDGSTENGNLSAQVSEAFYEGVSGNRQLYWNHPFETEAREKAAQMIAKITELKPELSVRSDLGANIPA